MNSSGPRLKKLQNPLPAVGVTATGLAEALDILCDPSLPKGTRLKALKETWWYIDKFRRLNYIVEPRDAHGDIVSLDRETLPPKTIHSIAFRSAHMITGRMLTAALLQGNQARLNELLSRHTSLGAATLILPVKEPQSEESAEEPSTSDTTPEDAHADELTTEEQPQAGEAVRPPLRLISGEGQGREQLSPEQRAAIEQFLEGMHFVNEGLSRIQSTLSKLLDVPQAVELLEQRLPGFKDAIARIE